MNQKKLVVVVIVAVLCLLVGLAGLYWFCRRSTASTLQHQQQDLHGKVESSVDADSLPGKEDASDLLLHPTSSAAELPLQQHPQGSLVHTSVAETAQKPPYLGGLRIFNGNVLGTPFGQEGYDWASDTIVVDCAETGIFSGEQYTSGSPSEEIYQAFGLLEKKIPCSLAERQSCSVFLHPGRYKAGDGKHKLRLVHMKDPILSVKEQVVNQAGFTECAVGYSLKCQLPEMLIALWKMIKAIAPQEGNEVLRIPVGNKYLSSIGMSPDEYAQIFLGGIRDSVVLAPGTDLASYLGIGEVVLCCHTPEMSTAMEKALREMVERGREDGTDLAEQGSRI